MFLNISSNTGYMAVGCLLRYVMSFIVPVWAVQWFNLVQCAGANIDPALLLAVFLPALLFESSFSMEVHQIKV